MFFKKKHRIRKEENERLLILIDEMKQKLTNQQLLVKKSLDPSPMVLNELKVTEAKYMFLLREARIRQTTKSDKD
ncbi:YaaL family protein [Alkalihalobacterium chitinilyticum]|uniref:YaaL family protein n=1 Tax=Alkalihalobacterium chitinilyticum TaxID=2980103 RepID=A0ABT5VLK5_9BACI|nr:YaaL family protein [Alkalihalobacterium chitinilyticum]MDE5416317.1 YaaL family protein [Alkalihalobacterium chitinilyticum]